MKYRLFGRDGLTDHEWRKIKEWDVAKRKFDDMGIPVTMKVPVKKKVMKRRINKYTGCVEEVKSDKSGSNQSAYTMEDQFEFYDN